MKALQIYFVDDITDDMVLPEKKGNTNELTGYCIFTLPVKHCVIYVEKGKKQYLIVLHELLHWITRMFFEEKAQCVHDWIDDFLTVEGN